MLLTKAKGNSQKADLLMKKSKIESSLSKRAELEKRTELSKNMTKCHVFAPA